MKLLLDTNVFIWASIDPDRLSPRATREISNPYNERYVSIASFWEMQIKQDLGKLPLPGRIDEYGPEWIGKLAAKVLPIELPHIGKLADLPSHHRDPFDRIIIAQAKFEKLELVSADASFSLYSAQIIW
jgi:PIN domain nuclease of toxin-antitoxin system